MDQPGKVANPASGQLNRENNIPQSPFAPENLVSRHGFGSPVPRLYCNDFVSSACVCVRTCLSSSTGGRT